MSKEQAPQIIFFTLRITVKSTLEVNKDLYLHFTDSTKAFNRSAYEEMIQMFEKLPIYEKNTWIIFKNVLQSKSSKNYDNDTIYFLYYDTK